MPDSPHVVVICTDQQRFDSLGCTGNPHARTPNIDALAAEGCVFERHFTAHPVCMPSRSTMMTGCYPSVHGVWTNGIPLPRRDDVPLTDAARHYLERAGVGDLSIPSHLPTFADQFAAAGYYTASSGKLHLTPTQTHRDLGFVESQDRWNHDPAMADWHGPYMGFERVDMTLDHGGVLNGHYRHWLEAKHPDVAGRIRESMSGPRPTALGDLYTLDCPAECYPSAFVADRACDSIDRAVAANRPLLLWGSFPDPHHPFTPPAEIACEFESTDVQPASVTPPDGVTPPRSHQWMGGSEIDEKSTRLARQYTNAMIHLIDRGVGQIVDRLKAHGMWDNTIVVFTADHGDYLGDYGRVRKCDQACRVLNNTPLIIRAPAAELPDRSDAPVSNADLTPTLCSLAGVTPPRFVQGEDISATLRDGRKLPVMIQSATGDPSSTNFSIIDGQHRLTWYPGRDCVELFDHAADPMEWHDVSDESHEVRQSLLADLHQALGRACVPRRGRVANW